jgi:hypothetical protein
MLVLIPLIFFLRPRAAAWRMVWVAWVAALVGGSFVTHIIRFHAPVMAMGFLLVAVVWTETGKKWALGMATVAATVSALVVLPAMANFSTVHYSPAGMCLGRETRGSYLARVIEESYGILADDVRRHTSEDSRILVVGDARSLQYPRVAFAQSVFDRQMLVKWLEEDPGPNALRRGLRRMGIDDVVVAGHEAARRGEVYDLFGMAPDAWRRLDRLAAQDLVPVAIDKWGGLFRVRSEGEPVTPTPEGWPKPIQLLSPPGSAFVRDYQKQQWVDAEKMLDRQILLFPNEEYWYEQRARMKAKQGKLDEACADLAAAGEMGVVHPDSLEMQRQWGCAKAPRGVRKFAEQIGTP